MTRTTDSSLRPTLSPSCSFSILTRNLESSHLTALRVRLIHSLGRDSDRVKLQSPRPVYSSTERTDLIFLSFYWRIRTRREFQFHSQIEIITAQKKGPFKTLQWMTIRGCVWSDWSRSSRRNEKTTSQALSKWVYLKNRGWTRSVECDLYGFYRDYKHYWKHKKIFADSTE